MNSVLRYIDFYREKLSLAYAFTAWNLFGLIVYQAYKGRFTKLEEDEDSKLSVGENIII